MSPRHPLAGRTIARMNGAGNAILVLDLRGSPVRATAEDARAIHRAPGLSYDQMMVLRDPKTAGTAADVLIYNNDGTLAGACGNGTRCVADRLCRELGAAARQDRDRGWRDCMRAARTLVLSGRHGAAAPRVGGHPASACCARHATGEPVAGRRSSGRAWARFHGQHGQPACSVLRPEPEKHRCGRPRPEDRGRPDVSGEGQCHLRRGPCARRCQGAGVGARCRIDARLRLGRVRNLWSPRRVSS